MLTRSQIAYNLSVSPHRVTQPYGADKLEFVFSSALYRGKFIEKQEENRKQIAESLSKRFGFSIHFDLLADLRLYSQIEKRGFLIYWNEVEVKCQEILKLDGERLTLKSSAD